MEILLNDNPLEIEGITEESKLSELLLIVEESLKGSGMTVVEIQLDDRVLSPDDISELEELKIIENEKINFVPASAQQMVQMAIEDGNEGLTHLEELATEISADLRIGNVKDAMEKYLGFVDGIEWFSTMLKNIEVAYAAAMTESSVEPERQALIARLEEQMTNVHKSQEGEDWVEMADILEYEFPELFEDGRKLFEKLVKKK